MSEISGGDVGFQETDTGEISEITESNESLEMDDELFQDLENCYNSYIKEGKWYDMEPEAEESDSSEGCIHELTDKAKQDICEETGWSEDIVGMMKSKEEAEIYKDADLKEEEIDGKKCLVKSDINMEQKDEFGRTNKERMANGIPPLSEDSETIELHHIGQKQDSPLAELTMQEHRGKGNDAVLHDKQKESEIDRSEFIKERRQHWESRSENL